jgi:hypothetical protein
MYKKIIESFGLQGSEKNINIYNKIIRLVGTNRVESDYVMSQVNEYLSERKKRKLTRVDFDKITTRMLCINIENETDSEGNNVSFLSIQDNNGGDLIKADPNSRDFLSYS